MQLIADSSFFTEPTAFIDYNVLNDPITSTSSSSLAQTQPQHGDFRDDIIERDGPFCIFTQEPAEDCDAVFIIPRSKGDEVITQLVIRDPLMNPLLVHSCHRSTSWNSL
jgi:hypothetical protein